MIRAIAFLALPLLAQTPSHYQDLRWRNVGPHRGGRATAVAGVPGDPQTYYFGSAGGGLWKTTDAGETWRNITDGQLGTSSVGAVAIAPSDPNVIYLGMGETAARGVALSHGDGVYKSTDAGRTWKRMGLEKTRAISRIRIHPSNPDLVYVAAQGATFGPTRERGVYRSTDGGRNWTLVLAGQNETSGASDLAMDPRNPRILYAAFWDHLRKPWEVRSGGPGSGFWKSSDGGDTWQPINDGLPKLMGKTAIDVSANSDRVYALVEADPAGGLYRSENGGRSWTAANTTDWSIKSRAWYYIEVYADPKNPDLVWVMNAGLLKSIDGGRTFASTAAPHGDHHDLWINPQNPENLINANDGGANVSFNSGRSWSTQQNQPTAQFYRVNTDERFPYWLYAGQQDNSTVAVPNRAGAGGIGWQDWHPVGGCESAYVAFDPKNPRYSYAGCYQGQISEFDLTTRENRDVMHYPALSLALPSREMKYRFNWNAPIAVSKHDTKVIYHASQKLLRSEDRGRTWREISPDLTNPDDKTQGFGGGPITNEGAGGEIYNTIFYVAESPHDRGVLYTGGDDGVVHVTRDGGRNWKKLSLPAAGDGQINAIEVSPHDPAVAYLAVTRYKYNDFTPYVFRTSNFGETWESIAAGLPAEHWARVVREDPVRKGLLYLGTEMGMFVSFDAGRKWQSLQLNLPNTPITDLQVRNGDLVASTSGRAFWVLDDVTPLRQAQAEPGDVQLFEPRPAIRTNLNVPQGGGPRSGQNPPPGAILNFHMKQEGAAVIEILAGPNVIRKLSLARTKAGMNRTNWDLRHEPMTRVPGLYSFVPMQGRKAVPGRYVVRLTADGKTSTQTLVVERDPRLETTDAMYRAQDELLSLIEKDTNDIHQSVNRIRAVRTQAEALAKNASNLEAPAKEFVEKLNAMEDTLIQKRTVDGQTVINFPVKLNHHFLHLRSVVDAAESGITEGARVRYQDLHAQWERTRIEVERLLGADLEALNRLAKDRGVGAIAK